MKKRIAIILLVGVFLAATSANLLAEELTGRQIMKKQKELHKVKTQIDEEQMLLKDKSGGKEKRFLKRYAKEVGDDIHRYLLVFLEPGDIRATGLLTWENKERENDQWLYMPAHKKMQRIAKGSKKNYFMGTDFTYEDMEPEDIDNFNYTILEQVDLKHDKKSQACWVIESVPANEEKAKESGYKRRVMWIEKAHFVTLKIEYYDRRDRLIKIQTNHGIKHVTGTVYRAQKTLVQHKQKNHITLTSVTKRKVNEGIDDSTFTERHILSGKHTR